MVKEYVHKEFYSCEFCGCRTNANLRRCCDEGYKSDLEKDILRDEADKSLVEGLIREENSG